MHCPFIELNSDILQFVILFLYSCLSFLHLLSTPFSAGLSPFTHPFWIAKGSFKLLNLFTSFQLKLQTKKLNF